MIKQIFLSRAINQEQRLLVDSQETASTAPYYENAWKQLAVRSYQVGPKDPAILDMLKEANIRVSFVNQAASTNSAPALTPSEPPSLPKMPVAP